MHSIVLAFGRDQPRWSLALSLPGGPECPVSQGARGKAQRSQCHHVTKGGPRLVTSVRAFGLVIPCRRSLNTGAVGWVSLLSSCLLYTSTRSSGMASGSRSEETCSDKAFTNRHSLAKRQGTSFAATGKCCAPSPDPSDGSGAFDTSGPPLTPAHERALIAYTYEIICILYFYFNAFYCPRFRS